MTLAVFFIADLKASKIQGYFLSKSANENFLSLFSSGEDSDH